MVVVVKLKEMKRKAVGVNPEKGICLHPCVTVHVADKRADLI